MVRFRRNFPDSIRDTFRRSSISASRRSDSLITTFRKLRAVSSLLTMSCRASV
jgi:hypothetical protein